MSVVEGNQQTNAVVHDRNETMINLDEREETNAQPEKQTICKMLVQWICQFTVLVSLTTIWLTDLPFTIGLVEDREQGWPKWYEFYSHIDITRKVDVGTKEETLVSYDDLLDLPEFKKCSNSKDLNGMEMILTIGTLGPIILLVITLVLQTLRFVYKARQDTLRRLGAMALILASMGPLWIFIKLLTAWNRVSERVLFRSALIIDCAAFIILLALVISDFVICKLRL